VQSLDCDEVWIYSNSKRKLLAVKSTLMRFASCKHFLFSRLPSN